MSNEQAVVADAQIYRVKDAVMLVQACLPSTPRTRLSEVLRPRIRPRPPVRAGFSSPSPLPANEEGPLYFLTEAGGSPELSPTLGQEEGIWSWNKFEPLKLNRFIRNVEEGVYGTGQVQFWGITQKGLFRVQVDFEELLQYAGCGSYDHWKEVRMMHVASLTAEQLLIQFTSERVRRDLELMAYNIQYEQVKALRRSFDLSGGTFAPTQLEKLGRVFKLVSYLESWPS